MNEKRDNEPAFVLHTYPWRETSLIVETFSRHHGRLGLVARGARRPLSSLKSRLLAFQPLELSWFGKGGLRTLHAAEWQGGDLRLAGRALMCGFYLNELLLKLLPPDDPHERLYDRYVTTLAELSAGTDPEPILRHFELDLLSELGYAQTLSHLSEGGAVEPDRRYGYAFDRGVVAAESGQSYTGKTLLDMAVTEEMIDIALAVRPQDVCLVPERRQELTTEGGLDVAGQQNKIADACARLGAAGIRVSLFIDPDTAQLDAARAAGAPVVEIHTGRYADAVTDAEAEMELARIRHAVAHGLALGLQVNAGHGLHFHNVQAVAALPGMNELNIGHAIVAEAIFMGWDNAVREMKRLMVEAAPR